LSLIRPVSLRRQVLLICWRSSMRKREPRMEPQMAQISADVRKRSEVGYAAPDTCRLFRRLQRFSEILSGCGGLVEKVTWTEPTFPPQVRLRRLREPKAALLRRFALGYLTASLRDFALAAELRASGTSRQSVVDSGMTTVPLVSERRYYAKRVLSFSFSCTTSGNCLAMGWSAIPANSRRAMWRCSGRTRIPFSLSNASVEGSMGTAN
jgi:hypothetical protein